MYTQFCMPGGRIFISYRREDPSAYAGWVRDRLEASLPNCIFFDVHSIEHGEFWDTRLREEATHCKALIAVIGKEWVTASKDGARRLDDPKDWVRIEIGSALAAGVKVVPLYVGGAAALRAEDLPEELKPLARKEGIFVDNSKFDDEIAKLVPGLRKALGARYWLGLVRALFSRRAWFAGYALLAATAGIAAVPILRPPPPPLETAPWTDDFNSAQKPGDKWRLEKPSWSYGVEKAKHVLVAKDAPGWVSLPQGRVFGDTRIKFRLRVTEGQKSAAWMLRGTPGRRFFLFPRKFPDRFYLFRLKFPDSTARATLEAYSEPDHQRLQLPSPEQLPLIYKTAFPPNTTIWVTVEADKFDFRHTFAAVDPRVFDSPPPTGPVPGDEQLVLFRDSKGSNTSRAGLFGLSPEPVMTLMSPLGIEPL